MSIWFLFFLSIVNGAPIITEAEAIAITSESIQANRIIEPSELQRAIDDSRLPPFSTYNQVLFHYCCQVPFCYSPYWAYLWCKSILTEPSSQTITTQNPIRVAEVINE